MSNERIDFSELEDLQESWEERLTEEGIKEALGNWLFDNGNELIAELKRCYEELDKWTNYATYIENVDMDCHKDASAEAGFLWKCTDCGAHFELPENGIYECEFGCDASE